MATLLGLAQPRTTAGGKSAGAQAGASVAGSASPAAVQAGATNTTPRAGTPGAGMGGGGTASAQPSGQSAGRNPGGWNGHHGEHPDSSGWSGHHGERPDSGGWSGHHGGRPDTGAASQTQPGGARARSQGNQPRAPESLAAPAKTIIRTQTLYILEKGVPTPRQVEVGTNDSYNTEIKSGLQEGDVVVLGLDQGKVNPFAQQGRPPTGGFGR